MRRVAQATIRVFTRRLEAAITDPGYGYYQARTDIARNLRNHIRQIQALGFEIALTKAP